MKPGIDPKVDYVFKKVFGSEEQKNVLVHLLNAVLCPASGEEVESVLLLNPFSEKDRELDKVIVLDIKACDKLGRWFNVEMQVVVPGVYAARALYYWAMLHASQLIEGDEFDTLRPTTSIHFLNSRMFQEDEDFHRTFVPFDREHQATLCDHMAIHFIELPKFNLSEEELTTPLHAWCYFLKKGESLDTEALPKALDFPEMRQVMEVLRIMSQNTREREIIEAQIRARRDHNAALRDALNEGRKEGRGEGRGEGKLVGQIQAYQGLLKQPVTPDEDLYRLSVDQLTELVQQLSKALANPNP